MVKDHSDSERGNLQLPHDAFICIIPQTAIPQPLLHQYWSTAWNEK